jgi:hypothetical protein
MLFAAPSDFFNRTAGIPDQGLDKFDFATQSQSVSENWAAENLKTIRTLMERTAVYRRALAPVSLVTGVLGIVSSGLAILVGVSTREGFVLWWFATGALAAGVAMMLVRIQALKDQEPIWSPPTRRVVAAMAPPMVSGLMAGVIIMATGIEAPFGLAFLPVVWMLFFGCALHSAGFFMKRGIRLLGWIFIGTALIESGTLILFPDLRGSSDAAHGIMGAVFGGYNLAYCVYLYLTEPGER